MDQPTAVTMTVVLTESATTGVVMEPSTVGLVATMTSGPSTASASAVIVEGVANGCKISSLWNWDTVDSCFISSSWQITSAGMFAGSCIGVILLVMLLEFLRRFVKEYDAYIIRKHDSNVAAAATAATSTLPPHYYSVSEKKDGAIEDIKAKFDVQPGATSPTVVSVGFRPTSLEQAIRALLHTAQFIVAYFILLLATYFNGYIIICIFIGAYLGAFIFQWELLTTHVRKTTASSEPAVFC